MRDRLCGVCGNTYPLDKKHFRWFASEERFSSTCLVCRSKQFKAAKEKKQAKREANLRRIEEAGVDLLLNTASGGGANIPHSAELLERLMQYFGGASGFASVVVKQYWDSQPGGSARNRLIETLVRLVTKNVESGGAKKPLSLWTEDELEDELQKRFQEALATFKGKTIDGKAETPKRIAAKEDEASEGRGSGDSEHPDADPVSEGILKGHPKRASRKKARGAKAVQPDAPTGGDPQVQGE